ncbi:MAG: A/G-specific adenine glycosylase [Flavobacteriaceae bacterium]
MSLIISKMDFSKKILDWYEENRRELPWRTTKDPYRIWLSEIILQQTRVAQGTPYYNKFIEHYPTVHALAEANEDQVLKLWQGLGYYTRARNLHATARKVANERNGKFPKDYEGLIKLKGIGDYTASAMASICFDEPEPVVDGNVLRVLARYFGITMPINSSGAAKYYKNLAREIMDRHNVRDYNQGIMEFGAIQCTPKSPNCQSCPLQNGCEALSKKIVSELPIKIRKGRIRKRYFNYLVGIDANNNTRLVQRSKDDIWKRLYEFPLLESESELASGQVIPKCKDLLEVNEIGAVYENNSSAVVHKLSHQQLHTKFWIVETTDRFESGIPVEQLEEYPVPVPIADFIKTFKNSYF